MTTAARQKAERCFALARSTTFDGERDAAIAKGTRIAEDAGLSLDLFDIPGRVRSATKPPPSRYRIDLFERGRAPAQYTTDELNDAMCRYQKIINEQLRQQNELAKARRRDS